MKAEERIVTTATELEVLNWTKRHLAFLVKDEALFGEVEQIGFRDYQGRFVVYYRCERKGRLFDLIEGDKPKYRFSFAGGGEIATDKLTDMDELLLATFLKRVEEDGRLPKAAQ